jgi:hypothetical protein
MTDGQSASLSWCQTPIWSLRPDFYYCQTVAVYWCWAFSLKRERVCRLQLLLFLSSAVILKSESRGTRDHILLTQIWDFPNLEGQIPILISPMNMVARLYPQALGYSLNWISPIVCQIYVTAGGQSASLFWCQETLWGLRLDFYYCQTLTGLLVWGGLSDKKMCLPFTIAAAPRQRSHSWVRVSRDSWPYFTVSHSSHHQLGGPGPRIYIPQEQGGPVILPGAGFPFRRLLRVSRLRRSNSNPPPRPQLFSF